MRHGYYLPRQDSECGDPELSAEARRLWEEYLATEGAKEFPRDWEETPPGRYDGVSVFTRPDGSMVRRRLVEDFLTEYGDGKLHVIIEDVPSLCDGTCSPMCARCNRLADEAAESRVVEQGY